MIKNSWSLLLVVWFIAFAFALFVLITLIKSFVLAGVSLFDQSGLWAGMIFIPFFIFFLLPLFPFYFFTSLAYSKLYTVFPVRDKNKIYVKWGLYGIAYLLITSVFSKTTKTFSQLSDHTMIVNSLTLFLLLLFDYLSEKIIRVFTTKKHPTKNTVLQPPIPRKNTK